MATPTAAEASTRLFQPLKVGHHTLTHRIAMAPLTRFRADENHIPSPLAAEYYSQRASTPGTLLVTEATYITPRAGGYPGVPGIWSDAQISAWKKISSAIHAKGSVVFMQLWALGRVGDPGELWREGKHRLVSASDVPVPGHARPSPLTEAEIKEYVQDYANAARNAIAAGFDGVELHGANGYLIDQFWQSHTNTRTDAYGGSIANRARFGLEIISALIAAVGNDPSRVAIRLSPFGLYQAMGMPNPLPQFTYIASQLAPLKLAYLSLVETRTDTLAAGNHDAASDRTRELDPMLEVWGKDGVVMIAGGMTPAKARRVVDEYYPERKVLPAFGRSFISTPDLPEAVRGGVELNRWQRGTFYSGGRRGYTDYENAVKGERARA